MSLLTINDTNKVLTVLRKYSDAAGFYFCMSEVHQLLQTILGQKDSVIRTSNGVDRLVQLQYPCSNEPHGMGYLKLKTHDRKDVWKTSSLLKKIEQLDIDYPFILRETCRYKYDGEMVLKQISLCRTVIQKYPDHEWDDYVNEQVGITIYPLTILMIRISEYSTHMSADLFEKHMRQIQTLIGKHGINIYSRLATYILKLFLHYGIDNYTVLDQILSVKTLCRTLCATPVYPWLGNDVYEIFHRRAKDTWRKRLGDLSIMGSNIKAILDLMYLPIEKYNV